MTFQNIKLSQEFIYNGLVYIKKDINMAYNDQLGNFIIYPNEKVKLITEFNLSDIKQKFIPFVIPFAIFIFGCVIGIAIFLIVK